MAESKSLRIAYGEALAELGAENDKIVVLDADPVSYTHLCFLQRAVRILQSKLQPAFMLRVHKVIWIQRKNKILLTHFFPLAVRLALRHRPIGQLRL